MRLNKFLAKAGVASRRKADELIRMATTTVNGAICMDPAYTVIKSDIIEYDGRKVKPIQEQIVIMLNKPCKIITTTLDTHGRKTVLDFIPSKYKVMPVGRLDLNTTGLLLLTNDGDLHQLLTHPSHRVPKDYEAVIEGRMVINQIQKIKRGIYIGDKEYGKAEILDQKTQKSRSTIIIRLRQGKKREIRRIMHRLKLKLLSLKRIRFAGLDLGTLPEGHFRVLSEKEVKILRISS